ncbi:hypothetical protein ACHAXH_005980 [Discostella pseudostelligera]
MGRLSRYKKVKSVDPFAKNGSSWKSDIGDCTTLHRVKRKSKTALKLKEQKMSKLQRHVRGKKGNDASAARSKKSGGSNGWGDDDGFDLPPEGGDEFDMNDLMGSIKKQSHKSNPLLDTNNAAQSVVVPSAGSDEKWTRKIQKVNVRDVAVASTGGKVVDSNAQSSKKQDNSKTNKNNSKNGGASAITAKTPTRDIIESCSNPKSKKQAATNASSSSTDNNMSKQEKRKAFFEKKKLKKRKRGNGAMDDDDSDDYADQNQDYSSRTTTSTSRRPAIDDQVDRPPTFSVLPRGANKLAKNKTAKHSNKNENNMSEDDESAAFRIRKEQQALEAMREKVMKQYAILRESRRAGTGR